jgi:hypothetical protein
MFAYAAYLKKQQNETDKLQVCSCFCHPGLLATRPQRREGSIYCETCNLERSLPFTELLELNAT